MRAHRTNFASLGFCLAIIFTAWGPSAAQGQEVAPTPSEPRRPAAGSSREGGLLEDVEALHRLIADQLQKEVESELREARAGMANDPTMVAQNLKLMLQRVSQTPELRAELRSTLRRQLEAAIREAARTDA